MKQAGFIIDQLSFHIDCIPFTLQTIIFRYYYKSNDVFYSPNSSYKVYLTTLKFEIQMDILGINTVLMYSTAYNL